MTSSYAVPGHVLGGRYLVEAVVGQGTFGRVFRAVDLATSRPVALKEFVREAGKPDSFLRELGILFELCHPNVIVCQSLTMSGPCRYMICEFMEGGSLRDRLDGSPIDLLHTLGILRAVAEGVAYAHGRNVIHRDLKPENVLLTSLAGELRAKVSDFGISTLSTSLGTRSWIGSPAYMAPEQFYDSYDHRVDVYALGVMAFEIICGRRPFRGTPAQLMAAHIRNEPDYPRWLPKMTLRFLRKSLAKKADRRFPTVRAFIDALDVICRLEGKALSEEIWPADLDGIVELAHSSDDVLVRTKSALLRLDRRGRVVEELPPARHVAAREGFSLIVSEESAVLRSPHGSRIIHGLPRDVRPTLSAEGSVAFAHGGGAYVIDAGGKHELRPARSGVTAIDFVGAESTPCLARRVGDASQLEVGGTKIDLPAATSRLTGHGSRYEIVARADDAPSRCLLVRLGEVAQVTIDGGDFSTDDHAFYAVSSEGELLGVSVASTRVSRTRWDRPLAVVAASSNGLVCGTRDGRVLAIR